MQRLPSAVAAEAEAAAGMDALLEHPADGGVSDIPLTTAAGSASDADGVADARAGTHEPLPAHTRPVLPEISPEALPGAEG